MNFFVVYEASEEGEEVAAVSLTKSDAKREIVRLTERGGQELFRKYCIRPLRISDTDLCQAILVVLRQKNPGS